MFNGIGSGERGEITFLDALSIIGFLISIENLKLNVSQDDMQKQTQEIDERVNAEVDKALDEIHTHLKSQDRKIDEILTMLKGEKDAQG